MKKTNVVLAVLLLLLSGISFSQTNYNISNKYSLEGNGGWDCVRFDDASGKLFISHGTMVQVLDVKLGTVVGTVSDLKGVHDIAVATEFNKGFISNGRDTSVTVFNLTDFTTLDKVTVTGVNPDIMLYDSYSKKVFVFNGRTANTTVIDAATNKVTETIPLDGKPEFAVSDGKGKVYVNIEDLSMIKVINTATMKVEKSWSISPGEEPSGLAFDAVNNRLFSVCGNKLLVVSDAENGKVITTLPIGEGSDGTAFDTDLKRIYSSNGEGTLTVVQQVNKDSYKVLETVPTQKSARTIAVDSKMHKIFLPCAEFGEVPEKTPENQHPRAPIKPGTFTIMEVSTVK
jgi:YVTN family beta-propeller protein